MSRKFLTAIDLAKNELQNAAVQSLGSAPASPAKFQLYGNSGDNTLYWWDGTTWVPAKTAALTLATTATTQAIGDTPAAGTSTNLAREDHRHGMPAFGSVIGQTAFGLTSTNGVSTAIARADHAHGTPAHDNAAHSAINLSALAPPTAPVNFNGQRITSVGTPTSGTDATTKDYVDNLAAGLAWKDAVRVATTANITLSGTQTIDGVAVVAGERVLVKNQTTASQNGIYVVAAGAWTRSTDADTGPEMEGLAVFALEGTVNVDTAWVCTTNPPIAIGTTPLAFVQFAGGAAIVAGAGLTQTGSTFDVVAANGSITVGTDNIQVAYAGTGAAATAARSDHNHDATYTRLTAADCLAATVTTVTHNWNTRDVKVDVYRNSTPWDDVECDIERPSLNTVDVRFAVAPTAAQYRIVVAGRS
jgi:hypothetical protein